jgi:hypothetical protein
VWRKDNLAPTHLIQLSRHSILRPGRPRNYGSILSPSQLWGSRRKKTRNLTQAVKLPGFVFEGYQVRISAVTGYPVYVFFCHPRPIPRQYLKLGHDRFLKSCFQLINHYHPLIRHYTVSSSWHLQIKKRKSKRCIMRQKPSWTPNSRSVTLGISCLLWYNTVLITACHWYLLLWR